jgi:hypothetical protein
MFFQQIPNQHPTFFSKILKYEMISKINISWGHMLFCQNNLFISKFPSNKKYLKYFENFIFLMDRWKLINRGIFAL